MSQTLSLGERDHLVRAGGLHWFHWLAVGASLLLTLGAWRFSVEQAEQKREARFAREAEQIVALLSERMGKYEEALWAGVGAMESHEGAMSDEQWLAFAQALSIEKRFPGINGIGVIRRLEGEALEPFVEEQRRTRPKFSVHPPHERDEYFPIVFIEPVAQNREAVGLDIAHERHRYEGAVAAAKTGLARATGPIVLVQDAEQTPGFLFYAPFYSETDGERRLSGLVYAPFVVKRLMAGALAAERRHVDVRISDGGNALYDELTIDYQDHDPEPLFTETRSVDIYGRRWTFDIHSNQSFRAAASTPQTWLILGGGLIIDALLLSLFVLLSRANRRAVQFAIDANRDLIDGNRALTEAREEALTAVRAKDEFLASISHELRTPLNAVIGLSEVVLAGELADDQRRHLEVVLDASESLQGVIEDMLDFSTLESGLLKLDRVPFDLHRCVEDVALARSSRARHKGLVLRASIDPALPRHRHGDPRRLAQVLGHLLDNAIKFTESGSVELRVERGPSGKPEQTCFSVTDTGIGIEAIHQGRVFDPFERVDGSSTRSQGGTGIGLPLCKHLVERMGGEIRLESRPGEGSAFHLDCSLEADANPPDELGMPHRRREAGVLPRQILLVEDSPANQKVARAMLGSEPQITVASNGREALEILDRHDFDLILMDVQMPEMDGLEATERLRARESSRGRHTPIVALTAHTLNSDRERCLAAGMDAFLAKPIRRDDLLRVVGEVMLELEADRPERLN